MKVLINIEKYVMVEVKVWLEKEMVDAIYIHIPFCAKKCGYCDFHSFAGKMDQREKYVNHLIKEIELYENYKYDTIYFGGGTPSLLEVEDVKRILDKLNFDENSEVTLELNPATADFEKLKGFREAGINRLSIGVQSFHDNILKTLGRVHSAEKAIETYNSARKAGFTNISLDLMFAVPKQGMKELEEDLEIIGKLNPNHISIYSLIWEENTIFWELKKKGRLIPCDNDLEADMFEYIIETLEKFGYTHYEVSNFAKVNQEARHNSKYWENKEYVAVGLGASYYYKGYRGRNLLAFDEYYSEIEKGNRPVMEEEFIKDPKEYEYMLGLRLLKKGIKPLEEKIISICENLLQEGYLLKEKDRYLLSKKGLFFANDVFERFL